MLPGTMYNPARRLDILSAGYNRLAYDGRHRNNYPTDVIYYLRTYTVALFTIIVDQKTYRATYYFDATINSAVQLSVV